MKHVQLGTDVPPEAVLGAGHGWRAMYLALRGAAFDLANTFFPSDCCVCGGPLLHLAAVPVCDACVSSLRPQRERERLCVRCGEALAMESLRFAASQGGECSMCRRSRPAFDRAVAYADYNDEVRELLHLLKFNGMRRVARSLLGAGMAEAVVQLRAQAGGELVIVPVPLYSARERTRGYNQATLLAQAALGELRRTEPAWKLALRSDVLRRVKDTNASFALNPSQRRKGLAGAFQVEDAEAVRGREVLLVDDILTTGATARECAKVLRRAGAAKVWVATYARAQEEALEMSVALWDAAVESHVSEARRGVPVLSAPVSPAPIEPDAAKRQRFVQ